MTVMINIRPFSLKLVVLLKCCFSSTQSHKSLSARVRCHQLMALCEMLWKFNLGQSWQKVTGVLERWDQTGPTSGKATAVIQGSRKSASQGMESSMACLNLVMWDLGSHYLAVWFGKGWDMHMKMLRKYQGWKTVLMWENRGWELGFWQSNPRAPLSSTK